MAVLFKREVPEVDDGTVQIMGVARDPGSRAKVAVISRDRDVDPVGACVGIRGSRIQNIVQELRGERIDIVVWSPDIATYAAHALSPAIISRITVDEDENLLEVVVPDDQLTLAIGRKGQNVKLASKLLGWKVDIYTESRYNELNAGREGLEQLASVAEVSMDKMLAAGYENPEQVAVATDEDLVENLGITESKVGDLRAAINFLGFMPKEPEPEAVESPDAEASVSPEETVQTESGGATVLVDDPDAVTAEYEAGDKHEEAPAGDAAEAAAKARTAAEEQIEEQQEENKSEEQ
jgi:N utilization substance protein A